LAVAGARCRDHTMNSSHQSSAVRALNHVALSLLSFSRLEDLLQEALERVMEVMETEAGAVHLLDEETCELRLIAQTGLPQAVVADADRIRLGEGLPGWVAQTGEALIVDDLSTDPRVTRRMARAEGFRGFAAVPLKTHLKTYGTMQVITHERRAFDSEDVDLLRAIGTQVGLGIENGQLILQLRERVETESLLHRVSAMLNSSPRWDTAFPFVAKNLVRALGVPRCLVTVTGTGSARRYYEYCEESLPKGDVALRLLARELETELGRRLGVWAVDDVLSLPLSRPTRALLGLQGVRSVMSAPLLYESRLSGVLLLQASGERHWRLEETALVQAVAHQAALALDRARLELDLRASERQFRDLVETARDLIFQVDRNGRVVYVNPVLQSLLQFEPAQVYQSDPWSFIFVHPDDRARLCDQFREAFGGRMDHSFEYRLLHRNGQTVRWVSQNSSLLRGPGNRVGGVRAFVRDITEQRILQQQMVEAQRLADLGRLAAQVAHEIRNPLGAIVSCVEVLQQDTAARADPRLLKVTTEEAAHLNTILTDLLTFAKPPEGEQERFAILEVVEDTLRLFKQHARSQPRVRIVLTSEQHLPDVCGDPHQIRQALWNLLTNALDAVGSNGGISVSVSSCAVEATHWIELAVSDTGSGVDPSVRAQIFDPFFTTKASGTGLGLAIVERVVREHGGIVQLGSPKSGDGTRFVIRLPGVLQ
jgi:PAS domain S-box-containing protein